MSGSVLCVNCDVQSGIRGAKHYDAFGIGKARSLTRNAVNRWVAKDRGRQEKGKG